jgi:diketogulonate reductase-like aldo/keto reductase
LGIAGLIRGGNIMRNSITDRVTLHNGVEMPWFGAGVFKVEQDVTARVVRDALQSGYRMIDTASIYGNEQGGGDGLRESGVDRKDIFLTT